MNSRSVILSLCLLEGARMLREQDEMGMAPPQQGPQQQPPAQGQQPGMPPQQAQGAPVGGDGQPLSVDGLIQRLNVIRGGKSFSDPEVYGQLTSLFKQMSDQDKETLDRTLMDIGKAVINAQENEQTPPPAQNPSGQSQQPQQQPTGQQGAAPMGAGSGAPPVAAV